eukprot:TRINITY_DN32736_c0_g1_i1.p1 TRINITY_DN32736_c0_g1~~TRINITY_DN32736_c0_g1_i1.p1  ORF type:complete len:375 (+),score=202.79 TRINITY_DN32736_c0_g1_i1:141-1265(+)
MSEADGDKQARIAALRERVRLAKEKKDHEEQQLRESEEAVQRINTELEKKDRETHDLKELRVKLQQSFEAEEEYMVNNLRKKLDALQKEKEELVRQAEKEEEYIANNLQRKLESIKREKIDIENRLEQEQEHIVNKLQQELLKVSEEKSELQAMLHTSRGAVLKQLGEQAAMCGGMEAAGKDAELVEKLTTEIARLEDENDRAKDRVGTFEKERRLLHTRLEALRKESQDRERVHKGLKEELERVTEERKNLFIQAEQVLEKEINSKLRSRKKRGGGRSSRLRSESELSTADSLSSSMGSSAISTPKLLDHQMYTHPLGVGQKHDKRRSSSVPVCVSPSDRSQRASPYSSSTYLPPTPTLTSRHMPGYTTPEKW